MGAGIALAVARGGFDVQLVEVDRAVAEKASARMAKDAERLDAAGALAHIRMTGSIGVLEDCDLVIEAVPEIMTLKHQIFSELDKQLPRAVLATNTSSLSVAGIADAVADPSRVIGLHFFNPAPLMQLVEIVVTEKTDEAVFAVARAFAEAIGKTPVEAADTPGFIVNRVARPFYLQSLRAYARELAPPEDLDALARGAGFRMGPFELMDLIGLDVNLATTESVYERTGADRFAPSPLQRDMVAAGNLGRKTGQGFYGYADGAGAPKADLSPPEKPAPNDEEVIAVLGFGDLADQITEVLSHTYANVIRLETDDRLDELTDDVTMVFDLGDGTSDRTNVLKEIDALYSPEVVVFTDAYTTRISKLSSAVKYPERFVGYGILGSFDSQKIVEIADVDATSDDAMALAEEVFAALGKRVILVGDSPGLYLGRTVASIVNEAVYAVQDEVASADDIDTAMRLGTNYPIGPIAWGREIGGGRVARILVDLANEEGAAFAPARALWVLDAGDEPEQAAGDEAVNQWAG
jgi:3-hydroxybutyryl-CoA dehydrogenase